MQPMQPMLAATLGNANHCAAGVTDPQRRSLRDDQLNLMHGWSRDRVAINHMINFFFSIQFSLPTHSLCKCRGIKV